MNWMKKFKLTIGIIRLEDNSEPEKRRVIEKFPDLFKNNTTIKDTEINIQLKPRHYPVNKKQDHHIYKKKSGENWKN